MLNILLAIIGKSGSGKDYITQKLELPKMVSHTTRQPRVGEVDGKDYHFVTVEDFVYMKEQGLFAEVVEYNGNKYGFTKSELLKIKESDCVALVTPSGYKQLSKLLPNNIILPVFLDSNDKLRKEKLLARHKDEPLFEFYKKQIEDRMEQDKKTFAGILNLKNLKHFVVDYTEETAEEMVREIKGILDDLHEREGRVVWVDFDDVIVDTLGEAVRLYNLEHEDKITTDMFKEWDCNKVAIGFAKYFEKIDFAKIGEKNNSIYWLRELNKHFNVHIATASSSRSFIEKEIWLNENMDFIPWGNIHCVRNKGMLKGYAIIDDGQHNIEASICKRRFLYDAPHNQQFRDYDLRINSLEDIYKILVKGNLGWE